ncbi:MAG: UDP-N-acetylmuramoyl-tripeptide--D-alanyl-D-alanine ligase, partial [Muribaculaceae bacterium]|nr:UDP-N-acetylmuramoyl-tripeptide--D-alanyl-D-alanine ligase [Muribaculaceae bacterium]
EFRRNLMMFQQNSYRPERYRRWYNNSGESTSFPCLLAIILYLLGLTSFGVRNFTVACTGVFALVMIIRLACKKYKKPLVMTKRATRLLVTMFILTFLVLGCCLLFFKLIDEGTLPIYLFVAVEVFLAAFVLVRSIVQCAAFLTKPIENRINRRFYDDAAQRLKSLPDLKIIGITGSYGKTSTKHYLYQILSEQFETLMTPGSFNTTLGVVRTIREYLKPYHEVFIVEMGAKQPGDIKEICDLVNPSTGIITAVGPQHLETFKTIENVRDTKFELVDALPADGLAVVNNDYPIIADRPVSNCRCVRYSVASVNQAADIKAEDIEYHAGGTRFTVVTTDGKRLPLETVLLGEYNIANLTAAVAVALSLGVSEDKIKLGVARIEPVEHRLSMKRHPNGLTIIDDAFNSNPAGASMAVDVLARMTGGRRIIITPGMIELGERQEELNTEFGRRIGNSGIEFAMIVGEYNREAILKGLREGGMTDEQILVFGTFLEANAHLLSIARPGDVALIENDLPDTFK